MRHLEVVVTEEEDIRNGQPVSFGAREHQPFILNSIGEGVHGIGIDGRITFENAAAAAMLGYRVDELIGRPAHETVHHHRADGSPFPPAECPIYRTMLDGKVRRVRNDLLWRKDGTSFTVDYIATPTRDDAGEIIGATVAFADTTERTRAEIALRESEELFRSMAEAIPQLIWLTDPDGAHTFFNRRWYEFTGLSPEESMGHEWALAFHPDDRPLARTLWANAIETGEPYEVEYRLRDTRGEYHWVLGRALPLHHPDGTINKWVGTCTNIDELKQALESARSSDAARKDAIAQLEHERRRLSETLDQSPNFTAVLRGPEHVFEMANDAYLRLVGARDLIGKPVAEALPELYGQGFTELLDHVLATGESVRRTGVEVVLERKAEEEPEPRYLDFIYQAFVEPDGSRSGVIVQGSDVTERYQAEERLRRADRRLRFQSTLLDAVGDAIMAMDPGGRIIHWDRECETVYGWTKDEVLDQSILELLVPEVVRDQAVERLRMIVAGGEWAGETRFLRKDGTTVPVLLTLTPLRDEEGEIMGVVGASTDISERLQFDEQLRQSQKMEALGRLAGGVAHDFNNLLTTIGGFADLLLDALEEDASAHGFAAEIHGAARRAAGLTAQLLAFSRKQALLPQHINPGQVIKGMERLLRRTIGEHIRIVVDTEGRPTRILADAGQVEQVVLNLAVNARDAMPLGGTLTISVDHRRLEEPLRMGQDELAPGPYAVISVRDTGSGIHPDVQAHVFEPFFTTKAEGKGTGLGLSTVYGIVRQSGGRISMDAPPEGGTVFSVFFPEVEGSPVNGKADEARPGETFEEVTKVGKEGTVLVAEDDPNVRALLIRLLPRMGFGVIEAGNGAEAVELYREHADRINLLLSDVIMPVMSGPELVAELKRQNPSLPVVFMSGYTDDMLEGQNIMKEVPLLQKPFTSIELKLKLTEAVRGAGVEDG